MGRPDQSNGDFSRLTWTPSPAGYAIALGYLNVHLLCKKIDCHVKQCRAELACV
jgi:hypothetical protein